ncbi:zinc-ribbon domain-containing protein [Roseobacter litoralis]|uniref:zinc-ribbon domain-containing protein n=1 Tax=Roseobacter litoralis TaxID=42443 RepID=UPI0024905729|nr:zinc-ribbon domain-containing protein [Roseobacter litoralis]
MRLICPNCDAQYEVPEDVMPLDGRDVQCSNCGQTWFQEHPNAPDDAPTKTLDLPKTPEPAQPREEPEETPELPMPPVRRALDPAVEDVLRAEAELEAQARKAEKSSLESQPDLGLDDAPQKRRTQDSSKAEQKTRPAPNPEKDEATFAKAASSAISSRRELLPDIEEINSTLRSNNDRSASTDPGQTAQIEVQEKRSARRGFVLAAALVAGLVLVYVYAPQIAQQIPQAEPALMSYVEMADGWRVWLDTQVTALLTWLDQVSGSGTP